MARAMLQNKDVAKNLWGEVVNTSCHTVNRVYFRLIQRRLPMNCGIEESQMWSISESLEVFVSSLRIERMSESLTPKVMK